MSPRFFSVFLMMGGINLMWGSSSFMYNLLVLRRKMSMSRGTMTFTFFMAGGHLLLWVMAIAIYLGYVEEELEEEAELLEGGERKKEQNVTVRNV